MRDPNRCFPVCDVIAALWQDTCPDLRFMQLMSNFVMWLGCDPFYMEDDEFIRKFKEYISEIDFRHTPQVIHKTPDKSAYM